MEEVGGGWRFRKEISHQAVDGVTSPLAAMKNPSYQHVQKSINLRRSSDSEHHTSSPSNNFRVRDSVTRCSRGKRDHIDRSRSDFGAHQGRNNSFSGCVQARGGDRF